MRSRSSSWCAAASLTVLATLVCACQSEQSSAFDAGTNGVVIAPVEGAAPPRRAVEATVADGVDGCALVIVSHRPLQVSGAAVFGTGAGGALTTVLADSRLAIVGRAGLVRVPECNGPWMSVSIAATHVCAVDAMERLRCWSDEPGRDLAGIPASASQPWSRTLDGHWRRVSSDASGTCALDTGGRVVCFGPMVRDMSPVMATPLAFPEAAIEVQVRDSSVCILSETRRIWCSGDLAARLCPDDVGVCLVAGEDVSRIAMGFHAVCGLAQEQWTCHDGLHVWAPGVPTDRMVSFSGDVACWLAGSRVHCTGSLPWASAATISLPPGEFRDVVVDVALTEPIRSVAVGELAIVGITESGAIWCLGCADNASVLGALPGPRRIL